MRKSYQALHVAMIALGIFTSMPESYSEELLSLIPGIAKSVVVEDAVAGKFTSIVGNPKIADVIFVPKNALWFIGLVEGTTNFIMVDNDTGLEMYSTIIVVENEDIYTNRVHVHNKPRLAGYTVYRCDPRCLQLREITASEPATLPAGHLRFPDDADRAVHPSNGPCC
jgi:Flp pilus assembly secretin CpaC